jgi:hypothetical protein
MWWIALLGCTPGQISALAEEESAKLLTEEVVPYAERTLAIGVPEAAHREDAEPFGYTDPESYFPFLEREGCESYAQVVEPGEDRVRVRVELPRARLLSWWSRGDLEPRVGESCRVSPEGTVGAKDGPGITLPGGARVRREGGAWRAEVHNRYVEADLVVPERCVDEVWVEDEPRERELEVELFLADGAVLLDEPDGEAFAVVGQSEEPLGHWVGGRELRREGPFVLVEVEAGELLARGWVDEADLQDHADAGWGWGGGCCGASGFGYGRIWPSELIPAGTFLRDEPGGELVGILTDDLAVAVDRPVVDGFGRAELWTPWGDVPVWFSDERGELTEAEPDEEI